VKTILTDSDSHSIIDHESIIKEFNLSDNSLATIENVYSDTSSKLVSENDRKKVAFGKNPGTVQIKVSSLRYNYAVMRQPTKLIINKNRGFFSGAQDTQL